MTSASQMSSRKPPVAQSTFGFPDDLPRPPGSPLTSSEGSSCVLALPFAALSKVNISRMAASTNRFPPPPLPSARHSTFSQLKTVHLSSPRLCVKPRKNVEKLSFRPHRLDCTSRRKKLFRPPFQHFPHPKTVQLSSALGVLGGLRSFLRSKKCVRPPSLPCSVRSMSSVASVSFLPAPKKVNTSRFFNIFPQQNGPTAPLPSPPSALFFCLAALGFNSSFGFSPWSFRAAAHDRPSPEDFCREPGLMKRGLTQPLNRGSKGSPHAT